MKKLLVDLENCYGIKKMQKELDFSQTNVFSIYAPNGAMKTSLAKTFEDIANNTESKDRIYPDRVCKRKINDENGDDLHKETIRVIHPYDEYFSHKDKSSTLLVDSKLRKEYEELHIEINKSKETFLKALAKQSGSKKDLEKEVSSTFTKSNNEFYRALFRIKDELLTQKNAPFADIDYDIIFDEKILGVLETQDVKTAIEDYIKKYNELLAASTYFKKGMFNYYNAATIAKSLADNGFFKAKHTVNLIGDEKIEITNQKQLESLIAKEKENITSDKDLRKKFIGIEKLLEKNITVRKFAAYLAEHEEILADLANIERFREEIWKSYIKIHLNLYTDLVDKHQATEKRQKEIEGEAQKQRTQWETVIDMFNERFFVPFKLTVTNRVSVILGQEPVLTLGFTYSDGPSQAPIEIEETELLRVLSTGEKKALYILNIIFEVEVRKKLKQETIFIIDDIADSFDYKNKYAIIQYLMDIAEETRFKQIILTHNFDFYRTIQSRFIPYANCFMTSKNNNGITLNPAIGIKNIFVNDWKQNFFTDSKKKIASIPFIRNIIEYTKGEDDEDYGKLTALLHWKGDSANITIGKLDIIYNSVFNENGASSNIDGTVNELIQQVANECLTVCESINFENKIVLSIAIRITAERYMVTRINDPSFVENIDSNQTSELLRKFKAMFSNEIEVIKILQQVTLMTPENIHLNSFMYEPILDMSDEHLRKLYRKVIAI